MKNDKIIKIYNGKTVDLEEIKANLGNYTAQERTDKINDLFNASLKTENEYRRFKNISKWADIGVHLGILSIFISNLPIKLSVISLQLACFVAAIKATKYYKLYDKKLQEIKTLYDALMKDNQNYENRMEEKEIFPDVFGEIELV